MSRAHVVLVLFISWVVSARRSHDLAEGEPCRKEGVKGTCRHIRYCPTASLVDLKTEKHPPICSFAGKEPVVCCTDCENTDVTKMVVTTDGIQYKLGTNKSYDYCLEFISKLPYSCKVGVLVGVTKQFDPQRQCHKPAVSKQYLLIGSAAERGEFPHMTLLGYGDDMETAEWSCGGSVISEKFILTAAHCSHHPKLGAVRFAAMGLLRRSDPAALWQRHAARRFVPHPRYRAPSKYHDIALLETTEEIKFSHLVLPICLADREVEGADAQAEGWGAEGHNKQSSDGLRKAWLERFTDEECDALYPEHRHQLQGVDRQTQVCYGDRKSNRDTCQGDSGGPLQVRARACVEYVVGVTSYGRACGFKGGAGIYTRVLPYLAWIEGVVWP